MMDNKKIPAGLRRKNPMNIRSSNSSSWLGQIGEENGFCVFSENKFGFRAYFRLMEKYFNHGLCCISQILHRYAPMVENNTTSYINNVSNEVGITPYQTVPRPSQDSAFWFKIACAMFRVECGFVASPSVCDDIAAGYDLAFVHR